MKRLICAVFLAVCFGTAGLGTAALAQTASKNSLPQKNTAIEGVTEYRLPNGLRVLTLPDPGIDTVTVHITYLVGSLHEGYGEKGMAHLLEHMLFKGSKRFPDVKTQFTQRGARWNGTTSSDRTTYFETLAASPANLDWALAMEADRMVNSFVRRSDLDSEMTVVRNEFEMGENSSGSVLLQRMQQLAFPWHNYGNPIIGERADIEQVPIDRLQAFYRTWYQPDNALLIVAGRFDEAAALKLIGRHFGSIPKPKRKLPAFYTREPTQDGERAVILRRAGDNQMVQALYRVPAGSHPDYPAIDILVHVLGDIPTGRLHRAIVQKSLASLVWGGERGLHDPGFMYFGASLSNAADVDKARELLLQTVESVKTEKVRADEVERARTALLNDIEKTETETAALVRSLSEFHAIGDWRLHFLYRDRLKKTTLADVQRVAEAFLKPANRVTGTFLPTATPDRAEIPVTPDFMGAVTQYRGGDSVALGEAFDASPANIESRVVRKTLANGIRAAFLPKKTRGARVVVSMALHWGDEKTLYDRDVACGFAGAMLMRGTVRHTRSQLKEEFERLNAAVGVSSDGVSIEVRRENLAAALRLVAEVLKEPSFPAEEFDEMKRAAITGAEAQRSDPSARAGERLARHLQTYPRGHPNYTPTVEERIEWLREAKLEDSIACYRDLVGATGADFVAVGDVDPAALGRLVEELFGGWRTPRPFERVPALYFDRPALENQLLVPDKANAALRAGVNVRMRDDDPDFAALVVANHLMGGSSTARIPARVREKEGLSYSTFTSFSSSPFDEAASFRVSAIFAPQNGARVEQAIREELARAVRDGFDAGEVEAGKKALLEGRRMARTQDRALVGRLGMYSFAKRTFAWDIEFEAKIASLTQAEVNAAFRRHVDPARLSIVKAGDFKSP